MRRSVDIGLIAESLLYYDEVLLNFTSQPQLAEFLSWLAPRRRSSSTQDSFAAFLDLLEEGAVGFYDYSFHATPVLVHPSGMYDVLNLTDRLQDQPNSFNDRYIRHQDVRAVLSSEQLAMLTAASTGKSIEVKASEFGAAIENALSDIKDPRRGSLVVQRFVDELFDMYALAPPAVTSTTETNGDKTRVTWNVDFAQLHDMAGAEINFGPQTPISAAVNSNKLLWSSATLDCDLFLPSPLSSLVCDKLAESIRSAIKISVVIDRLKQDVEFPDVQRLVNEGHFTLRDVVALRKNARRFRSWLQAEGERDRDAIIAYHHEVAKDSSLVRANRKVVNMIATVGAGAVGGALGAAYAGPVGGAVAGAVGSAIGYLGQLAARLGADWRPVVFGKWLEERVGELPEV